ncbi:hypothetical protein SEA_FIREMAN_24 [Microbacterium phage Fireman]|uniref:Uncharacterized protein n=2 Tax=Metamorphoovirus TaxID=2733195 RepID=A0A481VXD5_9CAUD|nr:hypothetical protein HOV22_gp24 [Microbacterium phage Fireman]YP_010751767.1 hypothetical protein QDA09_gp22 [Microbacterium phage Tyrumbra]QBI98107.1 hypothetical protein SEA_FIREMAN_24 [Microbacterium phage Fireman]QDP43559.1 hypothetical protein SEA_TYRUMBRA_22 [Microbacterium phage Tyrumbra]
MSNAFANEHQDNYFDAEEAGVAAHTAQSKFAREVSAGALMRDHKRFPDTAFPFSGDHLGTFSHRETTPDGDPGDEVSRERIYRGTLDIWTKVAA